jgi:hypothetical protein
MPELTSLTPGWPTCDMVVDDKAFYDAFPASLKAVEPIVPTIAPHAPMTGMVPYAVVAAALAVIAPIARNGERNRWLQIAYACKDVGDHVRPLFEAWQRRSPLWQASDCNVWHTLRNPTPGSHVALFALAKTTNPDWWRVDADAEGWMIERASQRTREDASALDRWGSRIRHRLQTNSRRGQ